MIGSYVVNYGEEIVSLHTQTDTFVWALMLKNKFWVVNLIVIRELIGNAFDEILMIKHKDRKDLIS